MPAWNVFRDIDSKWTGGIGRPSDLLSEYSVLHRPSDSNIDLSDSMYDVYSVFVFQLLMGCSANLKIESDVLDRPTAVTRDADEPPDYTSYPGKKSTSGQQKTPSASEFGTEQIPTSTDIERESIPVQVDSPTLDRAHKTSPPTPPPQKWRTTKGKGELLYDCCNCGRGPFSWERIPHCQNCHRRRCDMCHKRCDMCHKRRW